MHLGKEYHDFILASSRDCRVRQRFQRQVLQLLEPHATLLDFGAGTGIDARVYAAKGHSVLVYEPSGPMRDHLADYCREEIRQGRVVFTDLALTRPLNAIVADFAVLNLIADHKKLFAEFSRLVVPGGFVFVNFLNPYFLGDARYPWWRKNIANLLNAGTYCVEGDAGGIYRFTPEIVARAAQPGFSKVRLIPAGLGLATHRYMFMLFRRS